MLSRVLFCIFLLFVSLKATKTNRRINFLIQYPEEVDGNNNIMKMKFAASLLLAEVACVHGRYLSHTYPRLSPTLRTWSRSSLSYLVDISEL